MTKKEIEIQIALGTLPLYKQIELDLIEIKEEEITYPFDNDGKPMGEPIGTMVKLIALDPKSNLPFAIASYLKGKDDKIGRQKAMDTLIHSAKIAEGILVDK